MTTYKHEITDNARSFLCQTHENMTYDGNNVDVVLDILN